MMAVKLQCTPKETEPEVFYYLDEEGDKVKIVTDEDLKVALDTKCPGGEGKLTLLHEPRE
jgi:hypothetical protein